MTLFMLMPSSVCLPLFGTLLIFVIVCLKFWLADTTETPKIYCARSALTKHIINRCNYMLNPFQVPFLIRNGHIQTILGRLITKSSCLFEREYVLLKDGGAVALDWTVLVEEEAQRWINGNPVLILLPDLASDASSVAHLCCVASKRGFMSIVFNKRGHGDSFLLTPKLQTYGDPSDFRSVVDYIHCRFPQSKLSAIAYGMGTDVLFSYIGEYGSSCKLSSVVCISPGYDAEHLLSRCISFPYNLIILYLLKRQLSTHAASLSSVVNIDAVMRTNSLMDFEDLLHCRPSGYSSMQEYWEHNNPMREVDEATVPVLCINSLDDPICKKQCIPFSLFSDCTNFMLLTTKTGGHCGFREGNSFKPWTDKVALDYIAAVLSFVPCLRIKKKL